ncbi:acetylornithine deacetylase [Roseisalinus antarcticus]|uniref:Acetylornithine deacetylase n=1 Tax=Roseisalinus antarcticus TaxID=254357 RepID=A0A1Y5RD26_9RHOB|nr:acetylornithine deacetylase [Roseisalinus antarcticus]SLN14637.1 Acetylornithine deacetylase [Roseisalinus antarcticus]
MTTLDLLDRLVAFPTVSRDSNLPLIDWAQDFLERRGATVHRLADPTGGKAGLFATLGPAGPGGVMLSAHSDVVPTDGQPWRRDPFRLTAEGDRVHGRGTTDMKGFLACMLRAADAAAGMTLAEPLKLSISYDEEVGCRGIARMIGHLDALIGLPRLCIVGEPTSMRIATGHKGKAAYAVTCHGEAGHSAEAPLYRNALHLGADMLGALRELQADLAATGARDPAYSVPYSTVHAGRMAGGTALNIVPDLCTLDFEIRHVAAEPLPPLEALLRTSAERIGGTAIEIAAGTAYPGLDVPEGAEAVRILSALLEEAELTKVGFGTEAGHFDAAGVPALVCGPGDMAQGHKANEYIALDQLAACDRMLDRLLATLA